MHVDPMKPTLKAPESKRLKLKYGKLLSRFAFKFHLRRYTEEVRRLWLGRTAEVQRCYLAHTEQDHGAEARTQAVRRRARAEDVHPLRLGRAVHVGPRPGLADSISGVRNPPESTQIRPSTESVRIRNPFL